MLSNRAIISITLYATTFIWSVHYTYGRGWCFTIYHALNSLWLLDTVHMIKTMHNILYDEKPPWLGNTKWFLYSIYVYIYGYNTRSSKSVILYNTILDVAWQHYKLNIGYPWSYERPIVLWARYKLFIAWQAIYVKASDSFSTGFK